jgi:spore coat polysaccharide biosynthesis predicted glycosyltransferase SpsG
MREGGILRIHVLQDSLKFKDFTALFSICRFKSLIGFRNSIRNSELPAFYNFRVNDILACEMSFSTGYGDLQLSILNYISLNRFLKKNPTTHLVFRFESQPIDRAVIFASAGLTKSVGYWHSSMSMCENYTSLQFPRGFLKNLMDDELVKAGFPNRMLLPNLYCAETLAYIGYDRKYTALCGPTRHLDEIRAAKILMGEGHLKSSKKVAVAFSSDPASAKFMENAIIELRKMDPNIFFLVKTHPAFITPKEILKNLEASIGNEAFRVIGNSENLLETIHDCNAVVVSGTQLAFESMLVDVMPVIYEPKSSYIATNFNKFEDYCFIASTIIEVGEAIDSILNKSSIATEKRRKWKILIEKQFGNDMNFSWDVFINSLDKF